VGRKFLHHPDEARKPVSLLEGRPVQLWSIDFGETA
jgi:hypothetical protein